MGVCTSQNKNDNETILSNNLSQNKNIKIKNKRESLTGTYQQSIKESFVSKDKKRKISNSIEPNFQKINNNSLLSINIIDNTNNKNSKEYKVDFPASIGEYESPIFVNENEKIEITIKTKENMIWSFLNDENTDYKGYNYIKHNKLNLGCLLCRFSESKEIFEINSNKIIIENHSKGILILFCNLDLNDVSNYRFKGYITLKIKGGKKLDYNKLYNLCGYKLSENAVLNEMNNDIEIQIFRYINMARISPKKFSEDYLYFLNENEEIIKIMKKNKSLNEFNISLQLTNAAKIHNKDLFNNCTIGHVGSDKTNIKNRINKFESDINYFGENLYFGINNPLLIVINMLIDKYGNDKVNRNNILDNNFQDIGISLTEHLIYGFSCVIVFGKKKKNNIF